MLLRKVYLIKKSKVLLKKAGLFFVLSGFFSFIIGLETLFNFQDLVFKNKADYFFRVFPGNDFLIMVVGLTVYFISDIIHEGALIKHENNLTI